MCFWERLTGCSLEESVVTWGGRDQQADHLIPYHQEVGNQRGGEKAGTTGHCCIRQSCTSYEKPSFAPVIRYRCAVACRRYWQCFVAYEARDEERGGECSACSWAQPAVVAEDASFLCLFFVVHASAILTAHCQVQGQGVEACLPRK